MKTLLTIWIMLFIGGPVGAQLKPTAPAQPDDPAQSIQEWMNDNVNEDTLQFLDRISQVRVRDFFTNVQQQLDGTNIYDLGTMKAVALQVLPILKDYEETAPYAAWLEARLDDMDAANEMQRQMKAALPKTGAANVISSPPLKIQRSIWVRQLAKSPLPPLAKTYLPKLKQVFVAEKVPPELVWVAGVESSFEPKARSPAGAAGMFQLMPETAREEHLSRWPFDERYQPEKSAHAAARHLRELHSHYGNWQLALAAYNVGEGRVDKLLKAHKVHSFDAVARWLPVETQMYVPKVEATVFEREGLALADLKTPKA